MIDGFGAVECCYRFAGMIGIRADGLTLRQLFTMAEGRRYQRRVDLAEQAMLVWGMDSIDLENYLFTGQMIDTGKGGPVQVSAEVQAAIDAEVERIRRENPDLPTFTKGDD